ncbi:peptidoglycan-binding protein [Streptomyces sp. CA-294286]|uniref:peptidoglycan-binding protein n=1 Tax=Streptomyces sp. CA-294286 TaxID=3240070 RepID=UPI003D8C2A55
MIQFEEIQPGADCPCAGCADRRRTCRTRALPVRDGAHPAARGARRAWVLVTAAGVVLGGGGVATAGDHDGPAAHHGPEQTAKAPVEGHGGARNARGGTGQGRGEVRESGVRVRGDRADAAEGDRARGAGRAREAGRGGEAGRVREDRADGDAPTPQGRAAPLYGRASSAPGSGATGTVGPPGVAAAPKLKPATRADIVKRAQTWVTAKVPYSMDKYWSDGYRQDCSGYVSMAWGLAGNEWTGSLAEFGVQVPRDRLQPGDILLFHNTADPHNGSHVTIFGGWTDYTRGHYVAYEQTRPTTRKQATPLGYWSNADRYLAYRYKGLVEGTAPQGATGAPAFPGAQHFRPGQAGPHVERLGKQLVSRGFGKHYKVGPGPRWSEADRRNVEEFQRAQGWRGAAADGYPGPETWRRLFATTGDGVRR